MQYLIGVDIGTQGTKAGLFDENMKKIGTYFVPSHLISPKPGIVYEEADVIYQSVLLAIQGLVKDTFVKPEAVKAIGIDSQMAGIMGIDERGEAVTYYDSWLDTRCGSYVSKMQAKAGKKITEITGGPVTYNHGPKILWWKNERPKIYKKISRFVLPHAYVTGKMAGLTSKQAYFDYTCLQYSGFGDNYRKVWSEELLEQFDIQRDKLPRIVSPFEIVGTLTKEAASKCGLTEGVKMAAGAGDTSASVFGTGLFEEGTLLDCAGTASVLCSVVNSYHPDVENQTMTMMRSPVDGQWFPLAYINGGGLNIRWVWEVLEQGSENGYKRLEAAAEKIPAGSEGLFFLPHLAGRVLPNDPYMRGGFIGMDWKHGKGHLYRAVMEGIAYEYCNYKKILKQLYPQQNFSDLWAVGGGAKSSLFLQIKADMLDVSAATLKTGDTALIGSAVIAGVGAGIFKDYKEPVLRGRERDREFFPDIKTKRVYADASNTYLHLLEAVSEVYRKKELGGEVQ